MGNALNPYIWSSIKLEDGNMAITRYKGSKSDVTIPEGVTIIGAGAFSNQENLTSITIPHGVTTICDGAFKECKNLTRVTLPESLTFIGHHTFYNCRQLTDINIPDSVTTIGSLAFGNCTIFEKSITNDAGFTVAGKVLLSYTGSASEVMIPEDITAIGADLWHSVTHIHRLIAPKHPLNTWETQLLGIPAALGCLTHGELYRDPKIIAEYQAYISDKIHLIASLLFKNDLVQGVSTLADWGMITAQNFDLDFLKSAQKAQATQCIAFLLNWKHKYLSENWQEELEL